MCLFSLVRWGKSWRTSDKLLQMYCHPQWKANFEDQDVISFAVNLRNSRWGKTWDKCCIDVTLFLWVCDCHVATSKEKILSSAWFSVNANKHLLLKHCIYSIVVDAHYPFYKHITRWSPVAQEVSQIILQRFVSLSTAIVWDYRRILLKPE